MANYFKRPDPLHGQTAEQTEQLRRYIMAHILALEIKLNEYEKRIQALERKIKEGDGK